MTISAVERPRRHQDVSGGNAAAVISNADRVVAVNGYRDVVAAGQGLVDGVVHREHHVMQAGTVGGVADVHAGAFAHRIQAEAP